MKFRGRMNDGIAMKDFSNIISIISRISKSCIMRLTENTLYFIIELDEKAPSAWAEMSQSHFFFKYSLVGVTEENNEIFLEFDASMLSKSLHSLKANAKYAEIKLTDKRQPCLTVEIELTSLSAQSRQVVHDIPVRVIPRREWVSYQIPSIPSFDITLDMPELKEVRNIVERLKGMTSHIIVEADEAGHLSFKVTGFWADITTHFKDLKVWESKQNVVTATVDLRQFLMFFVWESIHPGSVKCNILHGRSINFNFDINEYLTIQYFIPAIDE